MEKPRVTVLLIEDNPRDAQIMRDALLDAKDTAFSVEWVDCVSRGVDRLARGAVDLILTDLQLSDSKGLQTVTRIREQANGVPIIVLTSLDDEALAMQALQEGAQDYLVKGYIQVYPFLLVRSIRYAIERSRAEQERLRLASFPEQHPHPIIEVDMTGMVTYANPAARAQFADLPPSGERHPILAGLVEAAVSLQREKRDALVRHIAHGTRTYEQHISYHPESRLVRSYLIDITERRQAEEREKEFAEAVAAAAVAEKKRAAELDEAYQELKRTQEMLVQAEKMAAVGQLASGIAHEVKNPLGVILHCVNYLEPELGPKGGPQADVLQVMREAVKTSDKIIRGLLDFSRPSPLELRPAPILKVINASLALVHAQAHDRKIRLITQVALDLPPVMVDENQMQQVFVNLILNAFHAMPDGGELTIRARLRRLTEPKGGVGRRTNDAFQVGETALVCEVEDTGTGIPREILPKVFNPFFTTKPPGEGVGLGLAITASIVEGHRGVIHIDSAEGRGTTVSIILPLSAPPDGRGRRDGTG
jgi:signal transduction histidine kinase